jgi:hypothetical protein
VIPKDGAGQFGWHNLPHFLATFVSVNDVHLSAIQSILRTKKMSVTVGYLHSFGQCQAERSTAEVLDSNRDEGDAAGANAGIVLRLH